MKALVKRQAGPGLELAEVPDPACSSDDVLIRVLRAGICGTDLHIRSWDASAASMCDTVPFIPGHEFYGEVVEIGADVADVRVGDRVSGEGHVVCGHCRNCRAGRRHLCIRSRGIGVQRDGAFAELVAVPQSNVWVHEGGTEIISPELGAAFDPLGNAVHTALTFPLVGEDVLVTGAGPIGLMAVAIARHAGARWIAATDVSPERLTMARAMGADVAVDVSAHSVEEVQEQLSMVEGFDVGLEMSGRATALREMIRNMNHGGKIALLGLPPENFAVDWPTVITHMLTLQGIYGREMFETWYQVSALLRTSAQLRERITSVITDVLPATAWEEAFDLTGDASRGKVMLDWTVVD